MSLGLRIVCGLVLSKPYAVQRQASVTLEELGVPYEVTPVSLSKNEQKEDWFLKINPNGCAAVFPEPG